MLERFINVHIEKTAGTSLRTFFETEFGLEKVLLFYNASRTWKRASEAKVSRFRPLAEAAKKYLSGTQLLVSLMKIYTQRRVSEGMQHSNEELTTLPDNFLILNGHFLATDFDAIWPEADKGVVIREPLQRMISQYSHWKRNEGVVDWRVKVPYTETMNFEEYALLPSLLNYQAAALDGQRLGEFRFVGVTERIGAYAQMIASAFCGELPPEKRDIQRLRVQRLNSDPTHKGEEILAELDPAFISEFRNHHKEDYQLYDAARKRSG